MVAVCVDRLEELHKTSGYNPNATTAAQSPALPLHELDASTAGLLDSLPPSFIPTVLATPHASKFVCVALSIMYDAREVRSALISSLSSISTGPQGSSSRALPEALSFVAQTTRRVELLRSGAGAEGKSADEAAHMAKVCEALTLELDAVTRLFKVAMKVSCC